MFTILATLTGVLNTITVMQNGQLSAFYGSYSGTVLIHLVGLLTVLLIALFNHKTWPERRGAPWWMYLGGVVGVGTVVFITSAYGGISMSAITALGLLGQSVTSIFADQYGLFGSDKTPFFPGRCWAVLMVILGVAMMIFPMGQATVGAVVFALLSGLTIVFARTLNGQLTQRQGAMRSTVMNYITGLGTSILVMLFLGMKEPMWTSPALSGNWFMYLGGTLGVCLIMLLNVTVPKVPAFAFTLLQFLGQMVTSLALDAMLTGAFSVRNLLGGILVWIGLALDVWMRKRRAIA